MEDTRLFFLTPHFFSPSLSLPHTLQEQGQKWNAPHNVIGQVLHHSLPGPAGVFTAVSLHRTDRSTFNAFKRNIFLLSWQKLIEFIDQLRMRRISPSFRKGRKDAAENVASISETAQQLNSEIPIVYFGLTKMKGP